MVATLGARRLRSVTDRFFVAYARIFGALMVNAHAGGDEPWR
ncbi:MAG TPA: hypothetical protein VFZ10_04370 [Geminicoccaceae bacterium]